VQLCKGYPATLVAIDEEEKKKVGLTYYQEKWNEIHRQTATTP
jgi:hypothetical protein